MERNTGRLMQNEDTKNNRKRQTQQEPVEKVRRKSDKLPFDDALSKALDNRRLDELSLEELEDEATDPNNDLASEELIQTKYTDGSTTNPEQAWEQGLVYIPPDDPPIIASDNKQGAEVAAGFAQSMEDSDPDVEVLPNRVNNNDLDLEDDILEVLRYSSETAQLNPNKLEIHVNNAIVYLYGTVLTEEDIAIVDYLVRDLPGVRAVENFLEVEDFNEAATDEG